MKKKPLMLRPGTLSVGLPYAEHADPVFFKWQRAEASEDDLVWQPSSEVKEWYSDANTAEQPNRQSQHNLKCTKAWCKEFRH